MKDQEHIDQLFQKYLNNTCTPTESKELIRLLQSGKERAYFESLVEKHFQDNAQVADVESHAAINRVFNKLELGQKERNDIKQTSRSYFSIAAAAIIIVASFVTFFHYLNQVDTKKMSGDIGNQDAAPGGNRATLILSDGTSISLDEMENGTIAKEDGIDIHKTAGGQLLYEAIAQNEEKNEKPAINTIVTPKGGQYQITLPDGTKVWLNASSALSYPTIFNGKERKVTLGGGEAYFEVSHQLVGNKPFIVETAKQRVEVLGTHFNVNSYADERTVSTTLMEGSVVVRAGNETATLKPGQQSQTGVNGIAVQSVDVESVMDWKNGDFIFVDEDLKSIMRKVSRWYGVDVVYEKNMRIDTFSGQISRKKNLSEVMRMLELSEELRFKIEKGTVYLSN